MVEKILIIGKKSQVAQSFYHSNLYKNLYSIDLRNNKLFEADVYKTINKHKIKYIVNCVGYTNVINSEKNYDDALILNEYFPKQLSKICLKTNVKLIHFSTDYVFDGKKNGGYYYNNNCNPKTFYGKSKHKGELKIKESGCEYQIIRLCGVYSIFRKNFVKTMLNKLLNHKIIKLPTNIICNPLYASDIPRLISFVLRSNYKKRKIIHFGGKNILSWFDFGVKIQAEFCKRKKINNPGLVIPNKDISKKILRPPYSVILDNKVFDKHKTNIDDAIKKILEYLI